MTISLFFDNLEYQFKENNDHKYVESFSNFSFYSDFLQ